MADRVWARAALAGNPSDGYGGRVVAVCIRDFWAQATARRADGVSLVGPDRTSRRAFASTADLVAAPCAAGDLLHAAARQLAAQDVALPAGFELEIRTTIPREVGLAGSSAIVTAALRALGRLAGTGLEGDRLAHLALAVETEQLGIAAGPQDRVVQAHGGLVSMDFATGRHEDLDPRLLPALYLAWRTDTAQASSVPHTDLRRRFEHGEADVVEGMRELATLAGQARDALIAGDHGSLGAAIDGSYDVRARLVELDPRHAEMVEIARAHGASANYAGSGGAVVGTLGDPQAFGALARAFTASGCAAIRPVVI